MPLLIDVENLEHSPLGPSSSKRWLNCTHSVLWTADMENTTSEYAAEGTFGHNISEYCRKEGKPASDFIGYSETIDGFTFECDAVFAAAVQVFLDFVNSITDVEAEWYELPTTYDVWVQYGFGTADDVRVVRVMRDGKVRFRVVVTDLKMGQGVMEFAKRNTQLMLYGLGVFQELDYIYDFEGFDFHISQPRLEHHDSWSIEREDLLEWAETIAKPKAKEAITGEGATFVAGEWCMFCPGKRVCKTRTAHIDSIVSEKDALRDINTMTLDELGAAFGNIDLISAWCKDITKQCKASVTEGLTLKGPDDLPLKMVAGRSDRVWKDPEAAEKALKASRKFKVADLHTKKLIGIPAVEKKLGPDHKILKEHVLKPDGKLTLVRGSDPRPAAGVVVDEMEDLDDLDEMEAQAAPEAPQNPAPDIDAELEDFLL